MSVGAPTDPRSETSDLAAQLQGWVGDRLLTAEQARRILAHEQQVRSPDPAAPRSPRRGHGLVVEALAYLGGVLALTAGLLLLQLVWPDLSEGARLAVPLSAAAALLLSGLLVPGDAPERRRLRGAFWALGTTAWVAALAVLGDQLLDMASEDTALLAGVGGSALALPLYLASRNAVQQLVLLGTASLIAGALGARAGWDEPSLLGLGIWIVAAIWLVVGERHLLTPAGTARYSGAVGMIVGALLMQGSLAGQAVAAGTLALIFVRGVLADRIGFVVVGAVGALNVIPSAMQFFFPDGGRFAVPFALLGIGAVLVGAAVTVTRRRSGIGGRPGG